MKGARPMEKFQMTLNSERYAVDRLPFLEHLAVARCPIPQIGKHDDGRLDTEDDCRVVVKVDVDVVVARGGIDFDAFNDLALDFWKARDGSCTLIFSHDVRSLYFVVR